MREKVSAELDKVVRKNAQAFVLSYLARLNGKGGQQGCILFII